MIASWYHHRAALVTICLLLLVPVAAGMIVLQENNIDRVERAQAEEVCFRSVQSVALKEIVTVLDAYLDTAVELRVRTINPDLARRAKKARANLREAVAGLREKPSIDCSSVVQAPSVPRPK